MSVLGEPLVELLHMAPTPLYSSYRYLAGEFDDELSMGSFVALVDEMIEQDVVRLWRADVGDDAPQRLDAVPSDIDERYRDVEDELDPSYDPYGYVLTPGSAAAPRGDPDWEVDVDFRAGTFVLAGRPAFDQGEVDRAFALFPDHRFVEVRRTTDGQRVRIEGIVVES